MLSPDFFVCYQKRKCWEILLQKTRFAFGENCDTMFVKKIYHVIGRLLNEDRHAAMEKQREKNN